MLRIGEPLDSFRTLTSGKWILAGEHAVLRGAPALAFPLRARSLELRHSEDGRSLRVETRGLQHEILHACAQRALQRALELLHVERSAFTGSLLVVNGLPCGAGLGASAALCVSLARWFSRLNLVPREAADRVARELEDLFHGESSGLDIAVVSRERPVLFSTGAGPAPFEPVWTPRLFLSDSGARAATRECVDRVKALLRRFPAEGRGIDADMKRAVDRCAQALLDRGAGAFASLAEAIDLGASCFRRWGLVEQRLAGHIEDLMLAGARAAKPTGAGVGGYVLSLWSDPPPEVLQSRLIPCFMPA